MPSLGVASRHRLGLRPHPSGAARLVAPCVVRVALAIGPVRHTGVRPRQIIARLRSRIRFLEPPHMAVAVGARIGRLFNRYGIGFCGSHHQAGTKFGIIY